MKHSISDKGSSSQNETAMTDASEQLFPVPDSSEDSRKLRATVHGLVTSASIITDREAMEGPTADNAWKWNTLRHVLDMGDAEIDIFFEFPCADLWRSQATGNLQALQYICELRIQALRHILQADLWPSRAEIQLYLVRNLVLWTRARAQMDLYWKHKHPRTARKSARVV